MCLWIYRKIDFNIYTYLYVHSYVVFSNTEHAPWGFKGIVDWQSVVVERELK